jgi:hypothetical protein
MSDTQQITFRFGADARALELSTLAHSRTMVEAAEYKKLVSNLNILLGDLPT